MMFLNTTFRLSLLRIVASCMLVLVVGVGSQFAAPSRAHALLGGGGIGSIVHDPTNLVKNAITAAQTLVNTGILQGLNIKDLTLDGIAWNLAKKVLAQTTNSLIDWINTGMNGKPAFITNLDTYMMDAVDQAASDFIAEENFSQMCEPLRTPVRIILDQTYRRARDFQERSQCTVSSGRADGIAGWFEATSNPYNNIYGATALAGDDYEHYVEQQRENALREADWGRGVPPVKDCSSGVCVTVTPGQVIAEYLNFKLTVGDRILIEADEIDEMIGNLFSQLGEQAITGLNGLLGLSYSDDGTTPSYLSQMGQQAETFGMGRSARFIEEAGRDEEKYLAIHEKALGDLENIAASTSAKSCAAATKLLEDILDLAEEYVSEIEDVESIIEILILLLDTFTNSSDSEMQMIAVEEFQRLRDDNLLHTTAMTTEKTFEIAGKVKDLEDREKTVCK